MATPYISAICIEPSETYVKRKFHYFLVFRIWSQLSFSLLYLNHKIQPHFFLTFDIRLILTYCSHGHDTLSQSQPINLIDERTFSVVYLLLDLTGNLQV
mgnify:CR=1 FL=1